MERCILCGGKLSGGRCRDCGLDNTKNDRKYRLNTHNEKDTVFHHRDCEDELNQQPVRKPDPQEKMILEGSQPKETQKKGTHVQQASAGTPKAQQTRAGREREIRRRNQTGTVRKKHGLLRMVVILIVLAVLVEIFLSVLYTVRRETGSELVEYLGLVTSDQEDLEEAAEEPEAIIWNEDAEGYFEEGLTQGFYTVGYDIPEGIYQLYCEDSVAGIEVWDAEGNWQDYISLMSVDTQESYAETYGECDRFELSQELVLEKGTILYVEECGEELHIAGEGAGRDSLEAHEAQKRLEEFTLDQDATVGEDFLPGVYDIVLGDIPEGEYGFAYLSIHDSEEHNQCYYVDVREEMPLFSRFPFEDGMIVNLTTIGEVESVRLVPSY